MNVNNDLNYNFEKSVKTELKPVLTIAGSDCSGGAGIQADLKTMSAFGCYGMSVITLLTAQNTTGINGSFAIPPKFVKEQIDSIFQDIRPLATKTGALFETEIIETIIERLNFYKADNIIVDPVIVCTANRGTLLKKTAIETMKTQLFAIADLITPNIPEAEVLCDGMEIDNREKMEKSAKYLSQFVKTGNVLLKGGHLADCCDDCLYFNKEIIWLKGQKIDTKNTHGTGCTLSSAIVSNLSLGYNIIDSIKISKKYITNAIKYNPELGNGNGPINHLYEINNLKNY